MKTTRYEKTQRSAQLSWRLSFTGHPSGRMSVRTLRRSPRARRQSRPTASQPLNPVLPCALYQQAPAPRPHDRRLAVPCVGSALTQPSLLPSVLPSSLTNVWDNTTLILSRGAVGVGPA